MIFLLCRENPRKPQVCTLKRYGLSIKKFEVVYNLLDVQRTVKKAAPVLKQKMLEKLPNIKFPFSVGNTQIKYKMALAFHCIKFPTLPSADFTLSFELGYSF